MQKKLLLILTIASLFFLTACAGSGSASGQPPRQNDPPQQANAGDDAQEPEDGNGANPTETEPEPEQPAAFSFTMRNIVIEMDQDIADLIALLGEPAGVFERQSCAFDGMDIIYSYSDVEIYTYPKDGANRVHTINFTNDSPITTEGAIRMGQSSLQDVFDAYGTDYEYDMGMYTFTRGLTFLQFYVENDIVLDIAYGLIIS